MMEVGVVVGTNGEPLHWHLPPGRTTVNLPDSTDLWHVLRDNRTKLLGVAHSPPGSGIPGPSREDVTTFAGLEAALGMRLQWWITSRDKLAMFWWEGPGMYDYRGAELARDPAWLPELRRLSYDASKQHEVSDAG